MAAILCTCCPASPWHARSPIFLPPVGLHALSSGSPENRLTVSNLSLPALRSSPFKPTQRSTVSEPTRRDILPTRRPRVSRQGESDSQQTLDRSAALRRSRSTFSPTLIDPLFTIALIAADTSCRMLHAPNATTNPSAALFNRSVSYSQPRTPVSDYDYAENASSPLQTSASETFPPHIDTDIRRAKSLRTSGAYGGASNSRILDSRRDVAGLSSFAAAGSTLTSPALSAIGETQAYTPPAASRHPLFAHHAAPSSYGQPRSESPSVFSDPGAGAIPPSPTESTLSSGFSPASAFLSHFSSNNSLRPQTTIAPDAMGAKVLSYTLGKLVGRGGFSAVREAISASGEVLACKIVKRDDLSDRSGSLERFEEEIKLWQSLPRHASLLPLIEMHRTATMTFLITPLYGGGSLLDVLKREHGSEVTARKLFPGVVAAVSALHEGFEGFDGGVLHGDLKLDNFLVDHHGHVVVCDFYMCRKVTGDGLTNRTATLATIPPPLVRGRQSRKTSPLPNGHHHGHRHPESESTDSKSSNFPSASMPYAPPELLRPPPRGPSLGQDIWALGCILYALLTDKLPFLDSFEPRLQMKILKGHWEQPVTLGKEWVECLNGCLDVNMDTRWDIARVKQCDAVIGWQEVKRRSKSRSRSRMRNGNGNGSDHAGPGGDVFHRGRKNSLLSHGPTQPMAIHRPPSRDHVNHYLHPTSAHTPPDPFGLNPPPPVSVSGSRSRSTGRSRSTSRKPLAYQQDLSSSFDQMNIGRGRSTATKSSVVGEPSRTSWQWNSRSRSRDPSSSTAPHTPRTASSSRPRPNVVPVPHTAPLQPHLISDHTTSNDYMDDSPTRSRSRGRPRYSDKVANLNTYNPPLQTSTSPSAQGSRSGSRSGSSGSSPNISRRSTSRSRNSPERIWVGGLESVNEEGTWADKANMPRQTPPWRGRSSSRGRGS